MENNPKLLMAVCVIQTNMKIRETFEKLKSVEVLTILQSPDTENVTFRTEDFSGFERLIALEIHGFDGEKLNFGKNPSRRMRLRHDVLRKMKSLQYINLEFVELLGSPAQGNKILPVSSLKYKYATNQKYESNDIPVILQPQFEQRVNSREKIGLNKNSLAPHLVFLEPNQTDDFVLPYKVYKEEQEKLGLYSFADLGRLKFLRVYHCNLREIYWDMFEGLKSLETLIIEGNELLFLPDFAFYGTPNLRFLSLAHNKLLSLQSMSLAGLLQLKHLDVSHNNITHLSELSLPPFPKLHSADFRENPLEIIFPSTFEIMNATQELYLGSRNTVVDIQPNSFFGLKSLTRLLISNVNLEILERDYLKGLPKLRELKFEGVIKQLAFDAFLEVPVIEKLILKNCSIEKISMDSFYGLYNLLSLDLSHNSLNLLPPGVFDQLFSLRELSLNKNNLTELPIGIFSNIPAKMIRLDGNPWHCTCAMKDWQPGVVNRVKQVKLDNKMCQFRFDKGTNCPLSSTLIYLYDKTVAPRCSTPAKYQNWSVFHLLRKELRCHKNKKTKIDRKAYLEQKLIDYEKMKEKHLNKSPVSPSYSNSSDEQAFSNRSNIETETPKFLIPALAQDTNKTGDESLKAEERVVTQEKTVIESLKAEDKVVTQEEPNEISKNSDISNNLGNRIMSVAKESVTDKALENILNPISNQPDVMIEKHKNNNTIKQEIDHEKLHQKDGKYDSTKIRHLNPVERAQKMLKYKQKMKFHQSEEEILRPADSKKIEKTDDVQLKDLKKMFQKDLELKRREKFKILKNDH
ncbi:toll-like receptor 13 isoform X2 [Nilaparvata lugens]|nr:toll-like receptor 13 isoform X2 [Nilaparvata lugens]